MSTPQNSSPPPLRSSDEQFSGDPDRHGAGLFDYVLGLGDDALISAQRMGWWISRAPQLEEDVALANIGLDQLGQARTLLAYAGEVEGDGRSEDDLAYLRDERDFRNVKLVERDQTDFGVAMARLLVFATWQAELYAALARSTDRTLAGVAGKAVKEVAYHLDHAHQWVLRLGDGTDESHAPHAGGPRRRVAVRRRALRRRDRRRAAWSPTGSLSIRPRSAGRCWRGSRRSSSTPPCPCPRSSPPSAVAGAGCTPRRWATCSPRCSTSPAPTRG